MQCLTSAGNGLFAGGQHFTAFVMRQAIDTVSPSNFVATNPELLQTTLASGGRNLVQGAANWWRDAMAVLTHGAPKDAEKFAPGVAVALTPGRVVVRNGPPLRYLGF